MSEGTAHKCHDRSHATANILLSISTYFFIKNEIKWNSPKSQIFHITTILIIMILALLPGLSPYLFVMTANNNNFYSRKTMTNKRLLLVITFLLLWGYSSFQYNQIFTSLSSILYLYFIHYQHLSTFFIHFRYYQLFLYCYIHY